MSLHAGFFCGRARPGFLYNANLAIALVFLASKKREPVTLLPGRSKLVTRPTMTGSPVLTKTIGISVVAALAAGAAGVFAAITATLRRTRSAAITWRRDGLPG